MQFKVTDVQLNSIAKYMTFLRGCYTAQAQPKLLLVQDFYR
jgi:hypothetical protein